MSVDDESSKNVAESTVAAGGEADEDLSEEGGDLSRDEKILKAKELYSQGSRNYLVKCYSEAADQLSEVCALYDEIYGEGCPELGMPYLLYAKSLIALAVDENKVLDVPDEVDEDDEEDVDEEEEEVGEKPAENAVVTGSSTSTSTSMPPKTNGSVEKPTNEADSTAKSSDITAGDKATQDTTNATSSSTARVTEDAQVSSSSNSENASDVKNAANGDVATAASSSIKATNPVVAKPVMDGEKPSTSNGDVDIDQGEDEEEDTEAVSNMRLAWEILELAAKIFSRQGLSGLPNLAEVQTELANIEFENNIMDAAREDYEKALKIYKELPKNYHRAMAEIHYKIGLTYLMQQLNKEGAASLKEACDLIDAEIADIKGKDELTEKDKNNIQDMEETKQEIRAKIDEIEEAQAQNIAEVRAALDSYIKPIVSHSVDGAGPSSSSSASASNAADAGSSSASVASSSKPKDISHLIKRKKPEESNSEAEASPAKRPAV